MGDADGRVVAMYICPDAGAPMQRVEEVRALVGAGLMGDRYARGEGSFNKGEEGKRQVSLINAAFFEGSGFAYAESRRNIIIRDVELMWLVGREFQVGNARMLGVKYCDPCDRPSRLAGVTRSFKQTFFDRGGLIAAILEGGLIRTGDLVIPPFKGY